MSKVRGEWVGNSVTIMKSEVRTALQKGENQRGESMVETIRKV